MPAPTPRARWLTRLLWPTPTMLEEWHVPDLKKLYIFQVRLCGKRHSSFSWQNIQKGLRSLSRLETRVQITVCSNSFSLIRVFHIIMFLSAPYEPPHDKTNKMTVRPAKTQISLGIRPVWSESSLCTQWVAKNPSFLHADSEDSDQTGQMPRLIWVFAGRTCHYVGFVTRRLIWHQRQ